MQHDSVEIGKRIKEARKAAKMSQTELANAIGKTLRSVQKYESGQVQNLKQSTIKKLCEIFNKYPDYFIFDDFDSELEKELRQEVEFVQIMEKKYGKDVISIFEVVINLNEESKKKVFDYVTDMRLIESVKKC